MIPHWPFFLTRRFLVSKRKEKGLATSILPTVGIIMGVMLLISTLGVMNGFQLGFIDSILEISSHHIRIEDSPDELNIPEIIKDIPEIASVSKFLSAQTLMNSDKTFSDPLGTVIRGVPPNLPQIDEGFKKQISIIEGKWDLDSEKTIVLGSELARNLGVSVGDPIRILALSGPQFNLLSPQEIVFTISGIFKSGFYEYDSLWGFVSYQNASQNFASKKETIWGIKLKDYNFDTQTIQKLISKSELKNSKIVSWQTYNSAFFGALKMEKTIMMVLICLIFIVVGINIFLSLQRSVIERKEDIGILKALGAEGSTIQWIFILEGLFFGGIGAFIGVITGILITVNVNELFSIIENIINGSSIIFTKFNYFIFQTWEMLNGKIDTSIFFERLNQGLINNSLSPSVSLFSGSAFYIPKIPAKNLLPEVIGIFTFGVITSTSASYFASKKVIQLKPGKILKAE